MRKLLTADSSGAILATMDNFLEYVKQRKAALRRELAELEAAERIYKESGADSDRSLSFNFVSAVEKRPKIKEAVLQLLREVYPNSLTALEILDRLNRRWWNGSLKRTSLSPQLSRLKEDQEVESRSGKWILNSQDTSPERSGEAL